VKKRGIFSIEKNYGAFNRGTLIRFFRNILHLKKKHYFWGTCKMRNETKRNEINRNETKFTETKRNKSKRNCMYLTWKGGGGHVIFSIKFPSNFPILKLGRKK
jgi:hypothetical protein